MLTVKGVVEKGMGKGAVLGFPTANIHLSDPEVQGIYAATVEVDGKTYHAAAFADPVRELLEAHMLDFSGELYQKPITVTLVAKIRGTESFDDEASLRAAIAKDMSAVRSYFLAHT